MIKAYVKIETDNMGYVEDTLGSGETIEHVVSFHWLWTFTAYLIFMISILLAVTIYTFIPDIISPRSIELLPHIITSLVIFSIGFIVYLYMMIKKWTTDS